MTPALDSVAGLRDKYRELLRLRREAAQGVALDPRAAMAALSARYPGALRELDQLPLEELTRRCAALDHALRMGESADVPKWALWLLDYHAALRLSLRIRRLVGREREAQRARSLLRRAAPELLSRLDREELQAVLRPPQGRLNRWALARVARAHGVSEDAVEAALVPPRSDRGR